MKDSKTTKAIINESEQLVCSFVFNKGDYSLAEWEILRNSKINGDGLDLEISGLVKGDKEKEKTELRQQLGILVKEYSTKFGINETDVLKKLYERYSINSRTELSYEDLQTEVETFRTAVINNIP